MAGALTRNLTIAGAKHDVRRRDHGTVRIAGRACHASIRKRAFASFSETSSGSIS